MASTNTAATRYFENEYNRDATFFHIGTCPHGSPAMLKKTALPNGLDCCCINNDGTVREDHNWSTVTLVIDLRNIVPNKRKTTKRDLLDSLIRWIEVKEMAGQNNMRYNLRHVTSATSRPGLAPSPAAAASSVTSGSSKTPSAGDPTPSTASNTTDAAGTAEPDAAGMSGTDDEDSLLTKTITVIDGIGGTALENIRLIISNVISLAKTPWKLFSFAVNGYYLVRAIARADIAGVVEHIQPFVRHYAPHWLRYINRDFYNELGGALREQRVQQHFRDVQREMEIRQAAVAAVDAQEGALHLRELEAALGSPGC